MSFRKFLLSSLFFMAAWALALGQNTVTVHGTVSSEEGDPQEGVVILASAYFVDSTVVMITMNTDADGQYAGSIDSPGPNIYGWLEVSMVDCWGTTISQNFEILTGSEDFTADFVYCQDFMMDSCLVIILEEWNPGNELELVAWNPAGLFPTYLWSTGDSTQSIFPQESGMYCVVATFPSGCEYTDCVTVVLDSNDVCFAYITTTPENDSTWTLEANHSGIAPFEYIWNTGQSTPTINNVGPGTYCVTVIDAEGCEGSACVILDDFGFCEVYISEIPNGGLTAQGFGQPPVAYLWSTGANTQTIYPNAEGLYCVTATDESGCSAESCYQYYFSQDTTCFVYINIIPQDSNGLSLQAVGYTGAESWLYEWSTGETTQVIYPSNPDETYCVTLTDSEGCVSSACIDFSDFCYSWVEVNYVDTNIAILNAWVDPIYMVPGFPEPTYNWSTGDNTPVLTVNESGEYCVTVTIGNNCVSESCAYVDFDSIGMNCVVWVYSFVDSSGNWVAEAAPWGFGDFDFLWSTGDTTPSINLTFPGQYACVTVTSSFGCEAVACVDSIQQICGGYIDVSYQNNLAILTANPWSLEPGIELLWSTGDTTDVITVDSEGFYCVTITTANCNFTACVDVVFWNVDSCGVWISYDFDPAPVEYTANAWGTPPFTYLWSNGETTQSVIIDFGDPNVCVTVTDASGCISSACSYPVDSCNISMYYSPQPVPSLHISSIEPIAQVIWSTGDSTEWIEVTATGTYCADVITIFGCFATVCYTIDSIPSGLHNYIEGVVFADSVGHAAEGYLNFYAFNPNSGKPYTLVDSAQIMQNGQYKSSPLPDGIYIIKAVMTPGSAAAEAYLPTYHYSGTKWQEAIPIGLPTFQLKHDVFLVPTIGLNGGGIIAGFVTDGQGIIAGDDPEIRGNSAGLTNVEIIIKDAEGLPLNYTWSLEEGAYRFENLPWGTYRISYEVAGLVSPDIWVTLTPENPQRLQVNIEIEALNVAVKDITREELKVYPNPAKQEVHFAVPGTNAQYDIQLVDMQGKILTTGSVVNDNGVITIDVHAYAPGLYHINLNGLNGIYYGRFIKQD